MPLIIEIRTTKVHGLETFKIFVNGTFLRSYMSKAFAEHKAKQLLHAWTVEGLSRRAEEIVYKGNEKFPLAI